MSQFTTTASTTDANTTNTGNPETSDQSTVDKVRNWLGLAPDLASLSENILSIFNGSGQMQADYETQLAVQSELYGMQKQNEEKQRKTIIIAAGVCLVAIIATVYFTRNN